MRARFTVRSCPVRLAVTCLWLAGAMACGDGPAGSGLGAEPVDDLGQVADALNVRFSQADAVAPQDPDGAGAVGSHDSAVAVGSPDVHSPGVADTVAGLDAVGANCDPDTDPPVACSVSNALGTCAGVRPCLSSGLGACDAPTPVTETCDGVDQDCDGETDEGIAAKACQKSNAQGTCAGIQTCQNGALLCDALEPSSETCNGLDDDCDGQIDEGFPDGDADGKADCADDDIDGDGAPNEADCAPADPGIHPKATETCDGKDENCDGVTDEADALGCKLLFIDKDGDGYGAGSALCLCAPQGVVSASQAGDCDDGAADVHPGAKEICNNLDDDCDAATDEGCDVDGDGWCSAKAVVVGLPKACTQGVGDCDDADGAVSPGKSEVCGNNKDDDCDGKTDTGGGVAGCLYFYKDEDKDGFGAGAGQCLCGAQWPYTASNDQDCDDADFAAHPSQDEVCGNKKDDDCDGKTDELGAKGCTLFYIDQDGDGFGSGNPICACAPVADYVADKGGDCHDGDKNVHPGAAEVCGGIDENCDGKTDEEGALGCAKYFADVDGDGFGSDAVAACLCKPKAPFETLISGDCNDKDKAAFPGAAELCNGADDDCDKAIDEPGATGCQKWWIDLDGDGAGPPATQSCLCAQVAPYNVQLGGDCDDADPKIGPGSKEVCDGVDNDCDGETDVDASDCDGFYQDLDGDQYGNSNLKKCLCKKTPPYTAIFGGDCNDSDKAIHPTAPEVCNGADDDCDKAVDEAGAVGCVPWYKDGDGDGYGPKGGASSCLCKALSPWVTKVAGDCNDNDQAVHPGATELCDAVDNDCNGQTDEGGAGGAGCKTFYLDQDGDGYGVATQSVCTCKAASPFTAVTPGDCDDKAAAVHPGATETCDGVDNDCNGKTDIDAKDAQSLYYDGDGDGWGVGSPKIVCAAAKPWTAVKGGDCNDTTVAIHPGQLELPCNGVDDNCDGISAGGAGVDEAFDTGNSGWSLAGAWQIASWCKHLGSGGLCFGNSGSSYPNTGSVGHAASKTLTVPSGASQLTFWYRYVPDANEYGTYDTFTVTFGSATLVSKSAGTKGSSLWQKVTYNLPANLVGTQQVFKLLFTTKDSLHNAGWGAAIDDLEIGCN